MTYRILLSSAALAALAATPGQAVTFHTGNGSIIGSLCVGNDCVSSEAFGFDTLRLKENNLRLHFDDTSNTASFPNTDWRLTANESTNGGLNKFSIDDATNSRIPFTIEATAPSNSLYVEADGDVGLNTSQPALELHMVDGDTPTVRLEQDGSSGFTAQTWDMAGNETNFFIRDATGGSTLVFRLRPGAPSNSIFVDTDGDVGLGDSSPDAQLDVQGDAAGVQLRVSSPSGGAAIQIDASDDGTFWNINENAVGNLIFNTNASAGDELTVDATGNLTVTGNLVTGGGGTCDPGPCDAVFDPAVYTVPSIEEHAAAMWANKHLPAVGPTRPGEPVNVTLKLTRMLNELEHAHIYIEQLHAGMRAQDARIETLEQRLASK